MTEEQKSSSVGWPHGSCHKHQLPPSLTGSSGVFVSCMMIAILMLTCLWFVLRQYQYSNLLQLLAVSQPEPIAPAASVICDLSRGDWVPDTTPPLYTGDTCRYINPFWNCVQNGRPDRDYLYWRWKPADCELPRFNASSFLKLLHGKTLAFIGDSIAKNHALSLLCALSQVEDPQFQEGGPDRWRFPSFNFTLVILWSPYLVQHTFDQEVGSKLHHDDLVRIHLDTPDGIWTSQLREYDIAIISTGYWYARKSVYHTNNRVLGASPDSGLNITTLDFLTAYRMAMETVLKYMLTEYQGITMLRTMTVDHFEGSAWNSGGKCNRTHPFSSQHAGDIAPQRNNEVNKIQVQLFEKAVALENGPSKLKLLNVTYSAYLRPDGHPGLYRKQPPYEFPNDCLHWCLPGPVDMWNQLVLHTLQPIYRRAPII